MTTSPTTTMHHLSTPEPIATEGGWSAYLDSESTGYVYYFNGVTGESTWEPPTPTFPPVVGASAAAKSATSTTTAATTATAAAASVTAFKEDRRTERQRRREQKKAELAASSSSSGGGGGGGGGLFDFFGGGGSREATAAAATTTAKTQAQQLSDLREIANNDEFLSELGGVIAEAEEAIAIASRVEEAPPKNKGGFFSSLGFVSGSEAVEEVESLITDAERTLEGVFSGLPRRAPEPEGEGEGEGGGRREGGAAAAVAHGWVEGLRTQFNNTFDAFIPPP
jgi:hypothetical protein